MDVIRQVADDQLLIMVSYSGEKLSDKDYAIIVYGTDVDKHLKYELIEMDVDGVMEPAVVDGFLSMYIRIDIDELNDVIDEISSDGSLNFGIVKCL